jgi:hypothetical protein
VTDEERKQVRNQTIDELCNWLDGVIEQVDHKTEGYKFGKAMVGGMRQQKD